MPQYKLPFSIHLERKYNDINIEDFIKDWEQEKSNRQERTVAIDNELHIELGKFNTYRFRGYPRRNEFTGKNF